MPDYTPRLGLGKPKGQENVDVGVLNDNFDKLDEKYSTVLLFPTEAARDAAYATKPFDQCYVGATKDSGTPYIRRNGQWLTQGGGGTGPTGPGVPDGGTAGQFLTKKSSIDQDTEWGDAPEPAVDVRVDDEMPASPKDPTLWIGGSAETAKALIATGGDTAGTTAFFNRNGLTKLPGKYLTKVVKDPDFDSVIMGSKQQSNPVTAPPYLSLDGKAWYSPSMVNTNSNNPFYYSRVLQGEGEPFAVGPDTAVVCDISDSAGGYYFLTKTGLSSSTFATLFGATPSMSYASNYPIVRYIKKWGKWLFYHGSANGTTAMPFIKTSSDLVNFMSPGTTPPPVVYGFNGGNAIQEIPGTDIVRLWAADRKSGSGSSLYSTYCDLSNAGQSISSRVDYQSTSTFADIQNKTEANGGSDWLPRYQYFPEKGITIALRPSVATSGVTNQYTENAGVTWSNFSGLTAAVTGDIWYSTVLNKYVAASRYDVYFSDDLKTWTKATTGLPTSGTVMVIEAFGKVIAYNTKPSYTTDGTAWTMPVVSATNNHNAFEYMPEIGRVVAYYKNTSTSGIVQLSITSSADGVSWAVTNPITGVTGIGSGAWLYPNGQPSPLVVPGPGKGDPYLAVTYFSRYTSNATTYRSVVVKSMDGGVTWTPYYTANHAIASGTVSGVYIAFSRNLNTFVLFGSSTSSPYTPYIVKLGPGDAGWVSMTGGPTGTYNQGSVYNGLDVNEWVLGQYDPTIKDCFIAQPDSVTSYVSYDGISWKATPYFQTGNRSSRQVGAFAVPGYNKVIASYFNTNANASILIDLDTQTAESLGDMPFNVRLDSATKNLYFDLAQYSSNKLAMNLFKDGKWVTIGD